MKRTSTFTWHWWLLLGLFGVVGHAHAESQATRVASGFSFGTNRFVALQLEPVFIGTNQLLAVRAETNSSSASAWQPLKVDLINLSPAGGFFVAFQVAFYGGLVLAAPFIFYFVALFVFPALRMKEKKYVYRGLGIGGALFAVGVSFCYFILLPIALAATLRPFVKSTIEIRSSAGGEPLLSIPETVAATFFA